MQNKLSDSELLKLYKDDNLSPYEIAEKLSTYPNKVRRRLVKLGVVLRDKSTSQSVALSSGRHKHPTKGLKRSESVKIKISEGLATNWANMSDENREKRVQQGRDYWKSLTDLEKQNLRRAAAVAVRKTSKTGSKLENFLLKSLQNLGYVVEYHVEDLVKNEKLQIDLYLPKLGIAIEVDGPSHFFPIWGEDSLKRHQASDRQKNGLLMSKGFKIIRIKHISKKLSQKGERDLLAAVVEQLEIIKTQPKKNTNFMIELEA